MQNLADGGQESLRALIQAIIPEANATSDEQMSADAVNRLTEKLAELMGPGATSGFNQHRNERGELVNEEGLPIVDITEPDDDSGSRSIPPPITVEPLIPLASLPATTRERLREKRNRILDLLEEEERRAEILEAKRESDQRDEILRKRREEAAREKDKLKQARELQKKMGRALLQNMGKTKEKEEKEKEAQRIQDEEADKLRSPSIKKKTVAFADTPPDSEATKGELTPSMDWGDLTLGRLHSSNRPTLLSQSQSLLDKNPMRMTVVERFPATQPPQPKVTLQSQQVEDSDDESEPESSNDSADGDLSGGDDEQVLEQDEVDFDFAQHQREIALEYYKKRGTIGQDAATAMTNHTHDPEEDMGVNVEGTREPPKPAISQFRASRLASAYSASVPKRVESTSLGASVIPESSTRTVQRAIKTGKLDDDGRLVGAEADSGSEDEDGAVQEVLELLRKGEVYNVGPERQYLHAVPPQASSLAPRAAVPGQSSETDAPKSFSGLPPPSMRLKTSKFKASRAAAGRAPTSSQASILSAQSPENRSPSITPESQVGRSSPKLTASTTTTPDVAEHTPFFGRSQNPAKSPAQAPPAFSMIVDSPSFPKHRSPTTSASSQLPASPPTMTIDSPSFPPQSARRPERPPTVISSTVRESTAASLRPPTPPMPTMTIDSPSFPPAQFSRRPDRPPTVMATSVLESRPPASKQTADGPSPEDRAEKKVSRFRAERARP